ncbi:DNA/RNA polymerase, partial [Violaceomyces palustris]
MTNADETFFPASKSVENIAILKACLGTGLIQRAHKLFTDLRNEARIRTRESWELQNLSLASGAEGEAARNRLSNFGEYWSPIEVWTYNSMLQAYLRKAYQSEALEGTSEWLERAWDLWRDMESGTGSFNDGPRSSDPKPNAGTIATMARGIVGLQRSERYPSSHAGLQPLLLSARRLGISFESILTSSVFNPAAQQDDGQMLGDPRNQDQPKEGEPDARLVLRSLSTAASQLGESGIVHELDSVQAILDGIQSPSGPAEYMLPDPLEGVTELRPVLTTSKASRAGVHPEKEEGEMPFNLVTLKENLSVVQQARRIISDPYERQKWLEHSALESARKRLEHSAQTMEELGLASAGPLQSRQLQTWMWSWYNKLQEALAKGIAEIAAEEAGKKGSSSSGGGINHFEMQISPFLQLLPPSKLALITILELMRMHGSGGVADGMKTTRALLQVGRAVETEYHAEVVRKNPQIFQSAHAAQSTLKKRGFIDIAARREIKAWQKQLEDEGVVSQIPRWTQIVRARVGSYLVQHLMQVATVNRKATDRDGNVWEEDQPAFYSAYQYLGGKKLGVIKLNEAIAKRLDKDSMQETLHPRHLPMLVPPKPWISHDSGGYYSVRQSSMRFKDSVEQGSYLRAASESDSLDVVLAGLDVLGQTSWQINRRIFDVMTEVWNSGKSTADMPPLEMEVPEPEKPENYDFDIKARGVYLQRLKQWNSQKAANHSQRCDVNYKLEIARAYLGERFYFPHNMDFRGRAYPMPPHLNHIGNDLCRGLLLFSDTKVLGAAGLKWLRIHLANVYGYDKASFAEREQFAIDHEADLRDSASDPLGGKQWWLKADDPWQCLATCMELQAALDNPEGPEAYASALPVHQDGTCNGLQHYAALGGDLAGAKQVNLSQGDRPADVYSGVADLVIKVLDEEAAKGERMAKTLQGKVTRKVVKQTVMTTVYGVTFIGAKNQVMRQLADRGDIPAEDLFNCASYLAKIIMSCIGDLFQGAQKIQDWLCDSAKLIARSIPPERIEEAVRPVDPAAASGVKAKKTKTKELSKGDRILKEQMTSVIWTTALGLPVVQPYRKVKKRQIATSMQTVFIQDPLLTSEVSPGKQASAFPPNFIHSLDATHMILTALECHAADLTFASVHDSYWTHACDIDTMSDIIRDTFIRLHTQDILTKLREEFLERYKGYKVPVSALNTKAKQANDQAKVKRAKDKLAIDALPDEATDAFMDPASEAEMVEEEEGEEEELVDGMVEDESIQEEEEEEEAAASAARAGSSEAELVIEQAAANATPAKQRRRSKKLLKDAAEGGSMTGETWEAHFRSKFVDLEDVLPAIPAKGSFDVNEIKRSLYFFS